MRLDFVVVLVLALFNNATILAQRESMVHRDINRANDFSNEALFETKGQVVVRAARYALASELLGDFDGDDDIDQHDYLALQICLSYSGPSHITQPACRVFDFDGDADIDLADISRFQTTFTGPLSGVIVEAGELFPGVATPSGYYSGAPGTPGNNALNGIARQAGYSQDDLWYQWKLLSKPDGSGNVLISNSALPSTAFMITVPALTGEYIFKLRVTNFVTGEYGLDTATFILADCLNAFDCNDDNPCTDDACNGVVCDHFVIPGCCNFDFDCDDGNVYTLDSCFENECFHGGGSVCGNDVIEADEQCDDGNVVNGDGCSSTCQNEGGSGIPNDNCANPQAVGEGSVLYSNVGATTDGPAEVIDCTFFGRGDLRSDLWFCYTASCSGQAVISLCGSGYDTKMAVYAGCECPAPEDQPGRARPLACSDDDCGSGVDNTQSRVTINATVGQSYMVRVGGFFGNNEQGEGRLTIRCGQDTCINGTGSCTNAHADNHPGCDTSSCCNRVCQVDTFCCDVTWDASCASQAGGYCSGSGFATCNAQAGSCDANQTAPGCNNTECCNAVCQSDPFCCITSWDSNCVLQADLICGTCGQGRGSCNIARSAPGCDDVACCARVCGQDEFCCNSEWDAACVSEAADLCSP